MRGRLMLWATALLVLGAAAAVVYWALYPKARPGWIAEQLPTNPRAEVELYRWKDANGQWVLSGEPPEDDIEHEVVRYRYDANVLPSTGTEEDDD